MASFIKSLVGSSSHAFDDESTNFDEVKQNDEEINLKTGDGRDVSLVLNNIGLGKQGNKDCAALKAYVEVKERNDFVVSAGGAKGPRDQMEDRFRVVVDQNGIDLYAAVFDGFDGDQCAQWLTQCMYEIIVAELKDTDTSKPGVIASCIKAACQTADDRFLKWAKKNRCAAGATAAQILIIGECYYLFTTGDCAGLVQYNSWGRMTTRPHYCELLEEEERIRDHKGELYYPEVSHRTKKNTGFFFKAFTETTGMTGAKMSAHPRIKPSNLRTSRVFGAVKYKDSKLGKIQKSHEGMLIPEPDIVIGRVDAKNLWFLMIGSDGFWDGRPVDTYCEETTKHANEFKGDMSQLSQRLCGLVTTGSSKLSSVADDLCCVTIIFDTDASLKPHLSNDDKDDLTHTVLSDLVYTSVKARVVETASAEIVVE